MKMWQQRYLWDYGEADHYVGVVQSGGPSRVVTGDDDPKFVRSPAGFVVSLPSAMTPHCRPRVYKGPRGCSWQVSHCGSGYFVSATWRTAMEAAWGHLAMAHQGTRELLPATRPGTATPHNPDLCNNVRHGYRIVPTGARAEERHRPAADRLGDTGPDAG